MYREEDLTQVKAQIKRRWQIVGIVSAVVLAVIIYSFVIRIEILTTALTALLLCAILFIYDLMIRPLSCYATHLENALHGRTRELEGEFISRDEDVSLVDGVKYYAMSVSHLPEGEDEAMERLFYFDILMPFPDVQPGDRVHVTFHDREVVSLVRL